MCVCGQLLKGGSQHSQQGETAVSPGPSEETSPAVVQPRLRPIVTYLLIGSNVVIFLLMTLAGGSTRIETLLEFGAMYRPLFTAGEYWRLVTPIFLHIGLLHLLFNMYALLVLGNVVEQIYGPVRYFLIYLFSGIAGALASVRFSTAVSAGASGAIFGLAGITLAVGYRYRDRVPANFKRAVGRGIIPFVIFNLAYGFSNQGIDNFAHLGGLVAGILLAFVITPAAQASITRRNKISSFATVLPIAVVVGAFFFPACAHFEMRQVEADFKQALALEKENRLDEAVAVYRRALKRRPNLPSLHNNLAVILTRQRKFADAEPQARLAVRWGEEEAMFHQTLGVVLWNESKREEAAGQYRRAIELDPKNAELHEALADLDEEQNKFDEALAEWNQVQTLRPKETYPIQKIEALKRLIAMRPQGK
jgi:rhomboid protease GluP